MTNLVVRDQEDAFTLPDRGKVERDLAAIHQFQELVHRELKDGHDYGVIPGTGNKPTLLKPGAEKVAKLLGLADTYVVQAHEDWDKPLFHYLVTCRLSMIHNGLVVAEGMGECNSMESKYRYRWDRDTQTRILNEDIYSLVNTLLKMAKKRALVDAALSVGRLSDLFTQDMDEAAAGGAATPPTTPANRAAQPAQGQDQYLCPTHGVKWFKSAKMRNYAHPFEGGWCNMPAEAKPAPVAQPSAADMVSEWKKSIKEGFLALQLTPADQISWVQTNCPMIPTASKDWKNTDWETVSNTLSNYLAGLAQASGAEEEHADGGPF